MSNPARTPPPAPANPTRQQIDELDALLQRMLTLPVNQLDEQATPPPRPAVAVVLPPETVPQQESPRAHSQVAGAGTRAAEAAPPVPSTPPQERSPEPVEPVPVSSGVVRHEVSSANGQTVIVRQHPPVLSPPPPHRNRSTRSTPLTVEELPGDPAWLRPLVWINRLFDRGTLLLGGPGRWLRRPRGRAVLGAAGLLCLAAAVVLVLGDWFGWTR